MLVELLDSTMMEVEMAKAIEVVPFIPIISLFRDYMREREVLTVDRKYMLVEL